MPSWFHGIMRNASTNDVNNIIDLIENSEGHNVLIRPKEEYMRSIISESFYVIEINNVLIAAAGVFYLAGEDVQDPPLEMGSCYVSQDFRGFGLQYLLTPPRICSAQLFMGENPDIYVAVKPDNHAAIRAISKAGFEKIDVPCVDRILLEPCVDCKQRPNASTARICCCDFHILPYASKIQQMRELLAYPETVKRQHREKQSTLDVQITIDILNKSWTRQLLEVNVSNFMN
jgi:hypothetical protein